MIKRISIIIGILIIVNPLYSQSQKWAKLYTIHGAIIYGRIISVEPEIINFEQVDIKGKTKEWKVPRSNIFKLVDENGIILVSNPELEDIYLERFKRLVKMGIITEEELGPIAESDSKISEHKLDETPFTIHFSQVDNPDGDVGTFFVDVGSSFFFGGESDMGDVLKEDNNFNIGIGVPLSNSTTLFGEYQRVTSSTEVLNIKSSFSVNTLSVKLRFYFDTRTR